MTESVKLTPKTHEANLHITSRAGVSLAGVGYRGNLKDWFKGFFSGRGEMTVGRKTDTITVTNLGGLSLAHNYLSDAEGYLSAAKQLNEQIGQFSTPKYFLLCHAIELALKAYILANGGSESEIRKIRHGLKKASDRAIELGLPSTNDRLPKIIVQVAPAHEDYSFRYNPSSWTHLLPPADVFETAVSDLIYSVAPAVNNDLAVLKIG